MAWLSVYGPAVDLTAVKVMLDAAADAAKATNPDDPRSLDQIRVDTLTELAWAILEHGHLPDFPTARITTTSAAPIRTTGTATGPTVV